MNILITGIHGFVGTNLVKELSTHHKIYGLDIVNTKKEGVIITYDWVAFERNEIPEVDVIIHLAGKAHDTKNYTKAAEYFEINTGLTEKIFSYFLKSNANKFIFFSSVKAVADSVPGDILTENVTPAPIGPYAESKLEAEKYIISRFPELALSSQLSAISSGVTYDQNTALNPEPRTQNQEQRTKNQEQNPNAKPETLNAKQKSVYILRPTMIHGPGNKGNLNLLYNLVKKGIPWPLGAFENRRSFTSIQNLNFVISQLVERPIPSGIYNMADDEALSTNEVITIIRETLSKKRLSADGSQLSAIVNSRIIKIPKPLIKALAALGTTLHLPLNKERLHKLTENYVVSNEKIKSNLGVDTMPLSASNGLKRTVKSFK